MVSLSPSSFFEYICVEVACPVFFFVTIAFFNATTAVGGLLPPTRLLIPLKTPHGWTLDTHGARF